MEQNIHIEAGTGMTPASLHQRLLQLRRQEWKTQILQGLLQVGLGLLAGWLLLLAVEAFFHCSALVRTILVSVFLLILAAAVLWLIGRPLGRLLGLLRGEDDDHTAERVGVAFPEIKDRLHNLLQLLREGEEAGRYYSLQLIEAASDDLNALLRPLDFSTMIDRSSLRSMGRFLPAVLLFAGGLMVLLPGTLGGAAYRLLHFGTEFTPPPAYLFTVSPGNTEVIKGADVDIGVRVDGQRPDAVTLMIRPAGQASFEESGLKRMADGTWRATLPRVRVSTRYGVRIGSVQSETYLLTVLDRPLVNALRLSLNFPSYTGLPPRSLDENVGDVRALAGTRIQFALEASKPLAAADAVFSDSTTLSLAVSGNTASGTMTLRKDRSYHIRVTDAEGISNADPIEYTLRVVPDISPTISIVAPGAHLNVVGDEELPMLFRLSDDYGISRLRLAHKLIHSKYERPATDFTMVDVPLSGRAGLDWLVPFTWVLSTLRLTPEDVVEYHAEVFDNDAVTGPKRAVSETFTLRLPSIDEVFADLDKGHEEARETLADALKQAEEAKKEMDELSRELKKPQQKLTWEEQKKAEEITRRYQEIQKKLNDVQQTVDRMLNEMQKNNVLSQETLSKYQELQQVMEEMQSPEFAEAMKRLQDAMQRMTPEAMQQALQQFSFSEDQFRKSIERTLNLLKRIQIEQKVDEAVKRAEEMHKLQQELASQKPDDPARREAAAKAEENLREQYEQMKKELENLQKKMAEFPAEMPVSEMQALQDSLQKANLEELLRQISQSLRQQQMEQAAQQQQQAVQAMGSMLQDLQQMQQQMRSNQQRQIVQEMRRAARDLLELSRRQEELKNASKGLDPLSQQFREHAQEQMNVLRDLGNVTNRLAALSQKTFGISPEMGKGIGEAMQRMQDALQSLDQRNGSGASQQQGEAMGALNQTAQQLQAAAQGMSQGGGQGMGMAGFMQRLQQLGGQQQGINDGTRGLTPEQGAALARLAGEQGMVRKSLEELAREASRTGELSKILGDLQRVANDMREVQTDMAQGNVNPETLQKQDRILSRLLDAQRSMRERDFEKRRKAESGTAATRQSPPPIDLTTVEGRNRLQRDLLRALEEGYARDYEELIKKYFEALQQ
ncbi:MAG TPA: DUF4175 family protein [Bacteroidota bacterium]|nr:DUF4175 family protein [Bacteroidota bacterium]